MVSTRLVHILANFSPVRPPDIGLPRTGSQTAHHAPSCSQCPYHKQHQTRHPLVVSSSLSIADSKPVHLLTSSTSHFVLGLSRHYPHHGYKRAVHQPLTCITCSRPRQNQSSQPARNSLSLSIASRRLVHGLTVLSLDPRLCFYGVPDILLNSGSDTRLLTTDHL